MRAVIRPSTARGTVTAPPSKSMAHRLLIAAALGGGESVVRNLAGSQDIEATIDCLRALGADIRLDNGAAYIRGADVRRAEPAELPCRESGSTLRFMAPLCMLSGSGFIMKGSPYLFTRPLSVYENIARGQGIEFTKDVDSLIIRGKLRSGVYEIPGDISSQFVTGLLYALPLVDGNSELRLLPPVESRPYIDMTLSAIDRFGIIIDRDGDIYSIKGSQSYHPADVTVEGDWSNAAFFEALNLAGGQVDIQGLDEDSLQGDRVYKILFEKIKQNNEVIDISDCPDLGPILFAAAAMRGGARFSGTRRLRLKESDRAAAMRDELAKFGIKVTVEDNSVIVGGGLSSPREPLNGHGDHRIVMSLAVLLTLTGGTIEGAQAVSKSFPDFFDKLRGLGVDVSYELDK